MGIYYFKVQFQNTWYIHVYMNSWEEDTDSEQ